MGLVVVSGTYSLSHLIEGFMPEAFLNGWIVTILVLFRPHWVY
ncbi:MAG: hypothetical protein V3U62_03405 [Sedimenticolaceae bacterium]